MIVSYILLFATAYMFVVFGMAVATNAKVNFNWPWRLIVFVCNLVANIIGHAYNLPSKAVHSYKEARRPPTPTEIAQDMIAQLALRYPEKWEGNLFKHKNVIIRRENKWTDRGNENYYRVQLGSEVIPSSPKMTKLLNKSVELTEQMQFTKARAAKEHRVLNEIEELLK